MQTKTDKDTQRQTKTAKYRRMTKANKDKQIHTNTNKDRKQTPNMTQ